MTLEVRGCLNIPGIPCYNTAAAGITTKTCNCNTDYCNAGWTDNDDDDRDTLETDGVTNVFI